MAKYAVVVLTNNRTPHVHCFSEIADALAAVLRDLGHDAYVQFGMPPSSYEARSIIFGAHHARYYGVDLPHDSIIYQMEPIGSAYFTREVVGQLNNHEIWEYSKSNALRYEEVGLRKPKIVPLGAHPALKRFTRVPDPDIDVIHFGALSPRRQSIIMKLLEQGLHVRQVSCAYGQARDKLLARSKLVLNIHYYNTAAVFESTRVLYCAANGVPVLSESSDSNEGAGFALFENYSKLFETTLELLNNNTALKNIEHLAKQTYVQTSFYDNVLAALM